MAPQQHKSSLLDVSSKQEYIPLVLDVISQQCKESSPHEIFQQIGQAIHLSGSDCQLKANIISGGYTNYSYRIFVDRHPELCVFAKLSFDYALWNPDRSVHYDLTRTENERQIMQKFAKIRPSYISSPLGCWDLDHGSQKMKLFVTEWSKGDEQFANQFIDGSVDPRIAPKLADALGELHNIKDFDPDFNAGVKSCAENMISQLRPRIEEACDEPNPKDRTCSHCVELGKHVVMKVMDASIANYHTRDCLIHSDAHVFNVLVEAKPSIEDIESFGPCGSMVLCDWEMAYVGPIGRDVGLALSFPIGCMVAHALNGHQEANESIEQYIDLLWDHYSSKMASSGKNSDEIAMIDRNIVGWCGWFQYWVFYLVGCQIENFPVQSKELANQVRDSLGVAGLKLLRLSYDTEYVNEMTGSKQLKSMFKEVWQEEVKYAHACFIESKQRKPSRKSSILRSSSRRFSDASMNFVTSESLKRLSICENEIHELSQ